MLRIKQLSLVFACGAGFGLLGGCSGSENSETGGAAGVGSGGTGLAGTNAGVSGSGSGSSAGAAGMATTGGVGAGAGSSGAGTGGGFAGQSAGGGGSTTSSGGMSGSSGASAGSSGSGGSGAPSTEKFSFFVTSVKAMVKLSGNDAGFGGDLSFGETGDGRGLRGADKICTTIAETSMPGNGKTWRAFLSATKGEDGNVVNAIDRIGAGPWYDRLGRLVAMNKTDLAQTRPMGADAAILNDLPNEDGVPNHDPDGTGDVDNHDTLTGSGAMGQLYNMNASSTCNDWTSKEPSGAPRVGHSWPRTFGGPGGGFGGGTGGPGGGGSGDNWMSALTEAGCAPGIFLVEAGPPGANGTKTVGDGGGYGGIYCFALTP